MDRIIFISLYNEFLVMSTIISFISKNVPAFPYYRERGDCVNFGDKLRSLLEEKDITQKQLAADLCIPASTLGGYIQNSSEPDFATLKLLAKHFDVSTDYLLDVPSDKATTRMEDELLRVFRSLTQEQQETYIEQGKAFIRIAQKEKAKSS